MTNRLFRVVGVRRDRLHDFIDADGPAAAVEQYAQRHVGFVPEVVQPCDDHGADAGEDRRVRGNCEMCGRVIFDDDEYRSDEVLVCAECVIAASSAKAVAS